VLSSNSVCQNSLLDISTPLSSRFQKASNMMKRQSNDNNNDTGIVNKNDQNKTVIEYHDNSAKFENLATNISSKNSTRRNHILDANQNNEKVPKLSSTSLNASMLKLNEGTKNEKIKSKFIIPVRKECSSYNGKEHSLDVSNDISKIDYKKKNEKGVKNTNADLIITHDTSTKIMQKTKTNILISEVVKKSNDVNKNTTDDHKQLTKKGKVKKSKESNETASTRIGKKEVTKKVEKVDSKGKKRVEVIEERTGGLNDDIYCEKSVSNGRGNDNNIVGDKDNDNINNDNYDRNKNNRKEDKNEIENQINNSKRNTNKNKSAVIDGNNGAVNITVEKGNKVGMKNTKISTKSKSAKDVRTIKDDNKNANKMKGKKKIDIENEDEMKRSDKVDTAVVMQPFSAIPRKNKRGAAAAAAVEVEEDSKTTEAMKNVPRKALLTSLLPRESFLEEGVSDDDSLSLGSEKQNDEMEEEKEEEMEERKGEEEIEVMNEGRSKLKGVNDRGNVDEQKHLTPNHHHDTDNDKNNNNDKEEDDNSDDEDDMFFAE
jgi:hypothetical protein